MTRTWPIFKREMKAYFNSPIVYVITALFLVVAGITFFLYLQGFVQFSMQYMRFSMQNPDMQAPDINQILFRGTLGNISVVLLFLLPFMSMRLFAEEKKSGTSELLFSYPVKDIEVVLGKFLAAAFVYTLMLALTLVMPLMIEFYGQLSWPVLLANYLGLLCAGLTYLALGIFFSSITENQIIAAALSLITFLSLWMVNFFESFVSGPMGSFLSYISILSHQENFMKGIIDTGDLLYYLGLIFIGLFLTLRALESRRWRT